VEKPAPAGTNKNRHIYISMVKRNASKDCLFLLLQHYKTVDKPKQNHQLVQITSSKSNNKQQQIQRKLQNNKLVTFFVVLLLLFPTTTAAA
jgi:hypothetical protein